VVGSTATPQPDVDLPTDFEELDFDQLDLDQTFANVPTVREPASSAQVAAAGGTKTQLQVQTASLLHIRTNTVVELPSNLTVIHVGKPNDRVPPDVDVSGFPDSEVVSRIHADIRNEGDAYYLEDVGSANGTYVNNLPQRKGDRYRLRPGDRISLGKGDKVSFLFQLG
jgi:pSer/pThr/pTyr-binding forkhead associated (FHA) protein